MEPASAMQPLPFGKAPREGQAQVFDALAHHRDGLNVKLPTGYGKTFTCCGVYSLLKQQDRVNRLLVIVPRDAQLDQFLNDAPNDDLPQAGVKPPLQVVDLRAVGFGALRDHHSDKRQIYIITVQSLIEAFGAGLVNELLKTGRWMVCVDEHHHYGEEKAWGRAIHALQREFLLVLSATPHRLFGDGAFGPIDVQVTYRDAVKEKAVKPLRGHAYHYELDVEQDGTIRRLSTRDLITAAGSDDPDKIEKLRIDRQMRWAPRFISPLVSVPIDRMLKERSQTGFRLQVIMTAICVSHAEYVCEQVREMYPELKVEWVGTGEFGRDPETNRAILAKFCPAKDCDGKRSAPELDVLVHVGIAGEGLDTVLTSEIVHLGPAGLNNRTNQINGRAARYLPDVMGHISFDASSELAEKSYLGDAIEDAMDCAPPTNKAETPEEPDDELPPIPPEEPTIRIDNINFIGIDNGDAGVQAFARFMQQDHPARYDLTAMNRDHEHPLWTEILDGYRTMRRIEAERNNDKAVLVQWNDQVKWLCSRVTGTVTRLMRKEARLVDRLVVGEIKHKINRRKMALHGELNDDNRHIDTAKAHYKFLRDLDIELRERGIPTWLKF